MVEIVLAFMSQASGHVFRITCINTGTCVHICPDPYDCEQILHYDEGQQFTEHHDYFDPATDPPENYEKGGNRLLTMIMYLAVRRTCDCASALPFNFKKILTKQCVHVQAAEEGGETEFQELNRTVAIKKGDAVMFYNLKHGCDGVNPSCVDAVCQTTPPNHTYESITPK